MAGADALRGGVSRVGAVDRRARRTRATCAATAASTRGRSRPRAGTARTGWAFGVKITAASIGERVEVEDGATPQAAPAPACEEHEERWGEELAERRRPSKGAHGRARYPAEEDADCDYGLPPAPPAPPAP